MPDIPLQSEDEYTKDLVSAVGKIAENVKSGSDQFSSGIESLSKSIKDLITSLTGSIGALRSTASNRSAAAPRVAAVPKPAKIVEPKAPKAPVVVDPVILKAKQDAAKFKADLAAIKFKAAQDKITFNAAQKVIKDEASAVKKATKDAEDAEKAKEKSDKDAGKVAEKSAKDAEKANKAEIKLAEDVKKDAEKVNRAVESAAIARSGLSAKEFGSIDDLINNLSQMFTQISSSGMEGSFDRSESVDTASIIETANIEAELANAESIAVLMADVANMLGDATDQAQILSSEIYAALDPKDYLQQAQDAINDLNPNIPDLNEFEQLFNDLADMFSNVQIDPGFNESVFDFSSANDLAESSIRSLIDSVLNLTTASGLGIDIAEGVLEGSQDAANIIGDTFRKELNQFAGTASGETNPFIEDLSQQATDLAISFGLLMEGIHSGDTNIAGFSDVLDFAVSSVSRLIEAMDQVSDQKGKNFVGPTQFTGPTQQGEKEYNAKKQKQDRENQLQQEDESIKMGVDNFSVLFEAMFGKMGKSIQNVIATTLSGINQSFSDKSPVLDAVKSMFGFSSVNKNNKTSESQTLSSGGAVGYFAKGTPKGGVFEGIGSVLGGKKKKNKSLLNNDEGNFGSIFKPKGTDTVPAMLTPGEEVVKKSAAKKPENKAAIDAMNKSGGGTVGYFAGGTPGGGGKGIVGGLASLALGPVGAAFSMLTGSVKAASDAIGMFGGFVAKANPAVMEQVGLAMNDLQGVIGRALVPAVQTLLPVIRYMGDGMDFVMKMLMPAVTPLVNAFKTLIMPLIEMESTVAQFLAPAFEFVAVAVEGFAIMLDPVIQIVSEIIESFTQILDSFLGGVPIISAMKNGFEILGQIMKMLVGAIVTVLGLFMSGMGVILQLAGLLISGFGSMVKGIGDLLSYIPGMGTIGAALSAAGEAVGDAGKEIVKSGEDLQKRGEDQRDRGVAKMGEGATNIIEKVKDPDYEMKDETRYKQGDVTGQGVKKGSSMGAAVRETQSTSISGVGDEIRKQALMAGTGAKTQEESLKDIADKLSKDNLRDAFKDGMIAANGAGKGNTGIQGKDPFDRAGHSKLFLAPV